MSAILTKGIWALPPKSNFCVSSSPEPLSLTTLRALHGGGSRTKLNPKSAHPSCDRPRPRVTISHMFLQSCPWSGRVPSSTSTFYQHPPALFHVRDCFQATSAYPFFGVETGCSLCGEVLDCWSDDAFAWCCSGVRVVRLTCLGVPAPRPTASLLVGWCCRKVLSGQEAGLRSGLLDLVSASSCCVSERSDFCEKASAKESRDQIIGVRQSGVDACGHQLFFTAGARLPAPLQVPEERKRWRMRFLVKLLSLISEEIQLSAALLDIQGDPGPRPLQVRRCFFAEHQRSLSQFAGLARCLGRSLSAQLSLIGRCDLWGSR